MRAVLSAIFLLGLLSSAQAACNAERATYKHLEDDGFTLTFSKQIDPKSWSNIQATLKTPARQLDFEFTASNGYAMQYLVLLTSGVKSPDDLSVSFLDKNLKSLLLPQAGEAAPEFVFAPDLGKWLYYSELEQQDYLPPGMWKLASCQ